MAGKVDWDARARTLVASHYDTKWFNGSTFTGANDGGSSTGLVLEAARAMARVPELAAKVEIVLFDGEEAIQAFTNPGGLGDSRYDGLYGSRYYARQLNAGPAAKIPEYMVLFDIIGHENCVVEFPVNCDPGLVRLALEEAGNMGQASSFTASSAAMVDDHVPLSWVGVNVIDYIALESFRSYWHTSGDSLDKVVPAVLERNGKAGLRLIERITME